MFGISYPMNINILEIITRHIEGLKKDTNLFWNILSSNILWQIWKCRNEERYQNNPRVLTKFFRKLKYFKIFFQVHTTMLINKEKLKRFLKEGYAIFEMTGGYEWRKNMDNLQMFEKTLKMISQEVKKNKNSKKDQILVLAQIQEKKNIVWMEGATGWTAWVDTHDDILH